jgi:phytoene dehydrogenase-like protein
VAVRELSQFATIGKKLWQTRGLRAAFQLLRMSAGDLLDSWFESNPIKAVLGFDAVVGNLASPYKAGSAYMLLHHVLGELNGRSGVWGYAIGGMGSITQAMARVATKYGARIDVCSEVSEVIVEGDRTVGVVLKDGRSIRARALIANVNPQYLFQSLLPRDAVPESVAARMKSWKAGSGTFRMNLALAKLPNFTALPGAGDHHTPESSLLRAFHIWIKHIAIASTMAGAAAQLLNWWFPRPSTTPWHHLARTWRPCFASM